MELKDYALIYSAVVATVALCWNIIESIRNRRGNLFVRADAMTRISVGWGSPSHMPLLRVLITNRGRSHRIIREVAIRLNSTSGKSQFVNVQVMESLGAFPKRLEPGDEFSYSIPMEAFASEQFAAYGASKTFQVVAIDTLGKHHVTAKLAPAVIRQAS